MQLYLAEAMKFRTQVLRWEPPRGGDPELSPGAAEFVHGLGTLCSGWILVTDCGKWSLTLEISEASWDPPFF